MVAGRSPDQPFAIREKEGAGIRAAVVDAADLGAVNLCSVDPIAIVAFTFCVADDGLRIGTEVEFGRGSDIGDLMDREFLS